jgi:DNA-binding GntR family transcriptional regulator
MGVVYRDPARRFGGPRAASSLSPQRLDRASTATRVAGVLRDRIAGGAMVPGSRIIELEVARELGVSRSPIREALQKLAEEGLVTILPYRGAIVAPLLRERLVELMEFRLALERFALERLIERANENTVPALRAHVAAMRRALREGDRRGAVDEDLAMHRAIVAMAGNALLERTYESLLAQIRLYIDATSARYERAEDLAEEHEALLASIERREFLMSRKLLDAHIMHGFDELLFEEP